MSVQRPSPGVAWALDQRVEAETPTLEGGVRFRVSKNSDGPDGDPEGGPDVDPRDDPRDHDCEEVDGERTAATIRPWTSRAIGQDAVTERSIDPSRQTARPR
jgi:hypothetical protein